VCSDSVGQFVRFVKIPVEQPNLYTRELDHLRDTVHTVQDHRAGVLAPVDRVEDGGEALGAMHDPIKRLIGLGGQGHLSDSVTVDRLPPSFSSTWGGA